MTVLLDLDELDLRILDVVQKSPPMSTAELAERVGLSQAPCWRRLAMLPTVQEINSIMTLGVEKSTTALPIRGR